MEKLPTSFKPIEVVIEKIDFLEKKIQEREKMLKKDPSDKFTKRKLNVYYHRVTELYLILNFD